MYENNTKLCISALCLCMLAYIFTPEKGMKVSIPEVSAKEVQTATGKMATGVSLGLQNVTKKNQKPITCDMECKISTLKKHGINDKIAGSLIHTCKNTAKDPVKCIKLGASILKAESGGGHRCYKNGCFGILAGKISYKSVEEGVEDWVRRYNKWWYKQENPSGFYSNSPNWKPKTHYCMSEYQPNGSKLSYCPNGHRHSWSMFNSLNF